MRKRTWSTVVALFGWLNDPNGLLYYQGLALLLPAPPTSATNATSPSSTGCRRRAHLPCQRRRVPAIHRERRRGRPGEVVAAGPGHRRTAAPTSSTAARSRTSIAAETRSCRPGRTGRQDPTSRAPPLSAQPQRQVPGLRRDTAITP